MKSDDGVTKNRIFDTIKCPSCKLRTAQLLNFAVYYG